MDCRQWEELLQRRLDGEEDAALQRHLLGCPHCAAHRPALLRLLNGIAALTPPTPPPELTDRLTRTLLREARQQKALRFRWRVGVVSALASAAALLIAVGVWSWSQPAKPLGGGVVVTPGPKAEPPPPLRESVARAGDALASLTNRTAKDTLDRSSTLLPLMKQSAEPLALLPAPVEPRLEQPLREATDSVSSGFSPVADSARRAVGLFLRDLPVGRPERAGDNPAE